MTPARSASNVAAARRAGLGLSFIAVPLVFIFAFAVHPNLTSPRLLGPAELVARAHGASLLHVAHALVTLVTGPLVVVAIHLMTVLEKQQRPGWGLVGGTLAVAGALALAADKGALCLTMSAVDTLPEADFANMLPGLLAMFSRQGWLVLLWGIVLLPIGFFIQALGLLRTRAFPRWRTLFFLLGVAFIGTPDGAEIVNLTAAVMLAVFFVPRGIELLRGLDAPAEGATGA